MNQILLWAQIIISILLIIVVTVQTKSGGLSRNWTQASFTRRGLEKIVFRSTFVLSLLFIIVSALALVV